MVLYRYRDHGVMNYGEEVLIPPKSSYVLIHKTMLVIPPCHTLLTLSIQSDL